MISIPSCDYATNTITAPTTASATPISFTCSTSFSLWQSLPPKNVSKAPTASAHTHVSLVTPSVTPSACQLPRRGSSRLRIKPRFQLLLLAYMRQREDHTFLLEGQQICCRLWRKQADGRSKKAGRFAPKDAAACVVPPYFTFPKKGMPLCAVSGAPSSLQSDLRHALSPSRLAACGRLSLTAAARLLLFFNGNHIR